MDQLSQYPSHNAKLGFEEEAPVLQRRVRAGPEQPAPSPRKPEEEGPEADLGPLPERQRRQRLRALTFRISKSFVSKLVVHLSVDDLG